MLCIETAMLAEALNEHPELAKRFMALAFLLPRDGQVEADLFDHLFNSSNKRLTRLLSRRQSIRSACRLDRSIRADPCFPPIA